MKKLLVIILLLAYGLSSSGMTIRLHYCCGELDGISINGKHDDSCGMSNEQKTTDCCSDKQISTSITSDQQAEVKSILVGKQTLVAPVYYEQTSPNVQAIQVDTIARSIPVKPKIPLFIKNCVFRI